MGLNQAEIDKQMEEADRIYEERYGKQEDKGDIVPLDERLDPPPENPPPPDPKQDPEPKVEPEKKDDYEHKYKTLQGILEAEQRRSREKIDTLTSQVSELLTRMNAPAAPVVTPDLSADAESLFATEYPDETLRKGVDAVARKRAKEVVGEEMDSLRKEISSLKELIGVTSQSVAQTQSDSYEAKLDREVPEWRKIMSDPVASEDFAAWLSQPIPYIGIPRAVIADEADRKKDAGKIIELYTDYLKDKGLRSLDGKLDTDDATPPEPKKNKMEPFIAPTTTPGSNVKVEDKDIITKDQVAQFQNDLSKGKYKDHPEKAEKILAMIDNAHRKGLIR